MVLSAALLWLMEDDPLISADDDESAGWKERPAGASSYVQRFELNDSVGAFLGVGAMCSPARVIHTQ
eukprot:COSAG01_NODE_26438_length_714_cov_0.917073_2_plen_66_part_01